MQEVQGVRLIVTPRDLIGDSKIPTPSVKVDDEMIAWDKGKGNGVVSEEELLNVLLRHGAKVRDDDE